MYNKITWRSLLTAGLIISLPIPALADPPAHAPAYGYYKNKDKNKHHRGDDRVGVEIDYHGGGSLPRLQCEHTGSQTGAVVGGIIGGVLGSKIGKGDGKTLATIAGTLLGGYVGSSVGAQMDAGDQRCAGETFELAQNQQTVDWVNPDTRQSYSVTPVSSYQDRSGQTCREYTSEVTIDGRRQTRNGTACRQANGEWRITN